MNDLMSQVADLSSDRKELLERLLKQGGPGPSSAIPRSGTGDAPLSFAQEQVWFLDQLESGNPSYNIAASVRFRGALDPAALEQALRAIAARHEILRTALVARDGRPVRAAAPAGAVDLPLVGLRALPEGEREGRARELAVDEARKPFALARGPLLRVRLLRLGADEHWLVLVVHHTAADGWSMRVLL